MKIIIIVLLLSVVTIYGFSDDNTDGENYSGMENLFFSWNLFDNSTEHFSLGVLNFNQAMFNNSGIYLSNNIFSKDFFSSLDNETKLRIKNETNSFYAFMFWNGLALGLLGVENKEIQKNFIYVEEQWNKSIKEEQFRQRIIGNNR
jgi:hypothetical protein